MDSELLHTGDTLWRRCQLTTGAAAVWDWTSRRAEKTQHTCSLSFARRRS